MTSSNKETARRTWQEIYPACDVEALRAIVDPDVVHHGARPEEPPGFEGVAATMLWLGKVFSDQRWEVHEVVEEGDLVALRATHHGRQTGDLFGIAPTGREVAYEHFHLLRFRDGKAVEHWGMHDQATLMRQLGVAPG
jgi:predicted ester cyclase